MTADREVRSVTGGRSQGVPEQQRAGVAALVRISPESYNSSRETLGNGVTVAQQTLDLLV